MNIPIVHGRADLWITMVCDATAVEPKKSFLQRLRNNPVAVSVTVIASYVTVVQAFRFDVRDETSFHFNLCYEGQAELAEFYSAIRRYEDDWAFIRLDVEYSCDDEPKGMPFNEYMGSDSKRTRFPKKHLVMNDPSNPIRYRQGSGRVFTPPIRDPPQSDDHEDVRSIRYSFSGDYTANHPDVYGDGFVMRSPSLEVEVVRPKSDDGYSYYREYLSIEGMQDTFLGPFFVVDRGGAETGILLRLKPVSDTPELFRAKRCNRAFERNWMKRAFCPLFIG